MNLLGQMAEDPELHKRLIAHQPDEELERKWKKAQGRWSNCYWAQEWLDLADRQAERLFQRLHGPGALVG